MENLLISGNTGEVIDWNIDELLSTTHSTKDQFEALEYFRKSSWIDRRDTFDYLHLNERLK